MKIFYQFLPLSDKVFCTYPSYNLSEFCSQRLKWWNQVKCLVKFSILNPGFQKRFHGSGLIIITFGLNLQTIYWH